MIWALLMILLLASPIILVLLLVVFAKGVSKIFEAIDRIKQDH